MINREDATKTPPVNWRDVGFTFQELVLSYTFIGVLFLVWLGLHIFSEDGGYITNLYTEIISIAITVGILNVFADRRQKREREELKKEEFIKDVSNRFLHELTNDALNRVRSLNESWIVGEQSLLKGRSLPKAQFRDAYLERVNLQKAFLNSAVFVNARLDYASLQLADLTYADLTEAKVRYARLDMATLSHVNAHGAEFNNSSFENASFYAAELSKTNFCMACLVKADLRDANLTNAKLAQTDLHAANLESANLQQADLSDSNLREVNLENADLMYVNFSGASLEGTNLRGANLEGAVFDTVLYTTLILPDNTNWDSTTDLAKFTDTNHPDFWFGYKLKHDDQQDFQERNLQRVMFYQLDGYAKKFNGAKFNGAFLPSANFEKAELRKANFFGADLLQANLIDADLTGANLTGARLLNANLTGANLTQAIFNRATILPDGSIWSPNTDMSYFTESQHSG